MADPLRRTLLAKLRGKKSKKGTAAGEFGAAANGGREGKEKVLQLRDSEAHSVPVVLLTELDCLADRMSGYENYVVGSSDIKSSVVLDSCAVVDGAFPRYESFTTHVNTSRVDNQSGSADLRFRCRVNEELLGVPLQREMQLSGNYRQTDANDKEGTLFAGQVPLRLIGGPRVQKNHLVPISRQYSGGDSIGFGSSDSDIVLHRQSDANNAVVQLTDGQVSVSQNNGMNVCCDKDWTSRLQHMAENRFNSKDNGSPHAENSSTLVTNATTSEIQMHPNAIPCYHPNSLHSEESILIKNMESYGTSHGYSGDIRVTSLQSPTYFPTELKICEIKVSSLCGREGNARHHSLDSEDDDYYDNEILPFYQSIRAGPNDRACSDKVKGPELTKSRIDDGPKGQIAESAQETDRLRSQLKEAYYLLINVMHDISFDGNINVTGFLDQASTSSHSQESICSRLSTRNIDSDSWSSGEHSPQQVSDNDSLLLFITRNLESLSLKRQGTSKSMFNLTDAKARPLLRRSTSDGAIRYLDRPPPSTEASSSQSPDGPQYQAANVAGDRNFFDKQVAYDVALGNDMLQDENRRLNVSSGSANSLTGLLNNADSQGNRLDLSEAWTQVGSSKAYGVTVNKMQEWMHRGRLLSSEMKQRIEGSSARCHGLGKAQPGQANSRGSKAQTTSAPHGGKSAVPPCQSQLVLQSALIENVQGSLASGCDVTRGQTHEPALWRPPLNSITVSKKRNWLQQSSGKHPATSDDTQSQEEDPTLAQGSQPPPNPCPDGLRPPGPPNVRPLRLLLPQVSLGHGKMAAELRCVDPVEENDADDEGEIWYNPIPEDDEPEAPRRPSIRLLVPPRPELNQAPQRRPSRGETGQAARALEGLSLGLEDVGESVGGGSGGGGDGLQGNAKHSMEPVQLHRQMLACKPQEEGLPGSKPTDSPELHHPGFSPPSSPNPTKKGSSINWSFPDKIKSPRTVRKLSMKMKKLPELSRKLSVKGTPSSHSSGSTQSEHRSHAPKTNIAPEVTAAPPRLSPGGGQGAAASRNVISRYHLDSSVSTQQSYSKKKSNGASKSASKGGYLSDGDSPELVAKSGKHGPSDVGKGGKVKEPSPAGGDRTGGGRGSPKLHGTELDIDAFRHYSFPEQPKCTQYISGLMSLHFYGAEDLKPPRVDSRDVYCAIQVDSVNKARTALLTCRTAFLDMDHTFNIELENAQHLKLVVFSWEPTPRKNRVCCHGTVALPALFRVTKSHQLAVKLEPRGLIYVKLNLMEQWQNSLDGGRGGEREMQVFGVEAWRVVEREAMGLAVPLLIDKCITEIEKRGCQVVGLYRLCGSAAVKKELREAFERDSYSVELCENTYPDINVITGVLKDYLRELPYPLITKNLYEAVLDCMAKRPLRIGAGGCENDQSDSDHTVSLLDNLPEVERVTLRKLLDHLKLVASHHEVNKMTCQNLAVCFGPVLLSQRQEASCHSNRVFIDSEELASALHFKKHIEVLHYLLQLWPVVDPHGKTSSPTPDASSPVTSANLLAAPPLRRRKERPQVLNLSDAEIAGVLRPKPGRLDSPSNRYAGDWSGCGERYFPPVLLPPEEADYADVPSDDMDVTEEGQERREPENAQEPGVPGQVPAPIEHEPPVVSVEDMTVGRVEGERAAEEEVEESDGSGVEPLNDRVCDHILPPHHLPKEHKYQAYMKIQDMSPVLSNRVNLRDLQESIDTLIGNLERELNKNKLNVGY